MWSQKCSEINISQKPVIGLEFPSSAIKNGDHDDSTAGLVERGSAAWSAQTLAPGRLSPTSSARTFHLQSTKYQISWHAFRSSVELNCLEYEHQGSLHVPFQTGVLFKSLQALGARCCGRRVTSSTRKFTLLLASRRLCREESGLHSCPFLVHESDGRAHRDTRAQQQLEFLCDLDDNCRTCARHGQQETQ